MTDGKAVAQGKARPRAVRYAIALCKFILAQWLIIGFGVACTLAYFFPSTYHCVIPCNTSY